MRTRNLRSNAEEAWYPIELPISYEGAKESTLQGDGRTLAISRGGVRFACDRTLLVGQTVRLSIQWPARLYDGASLSLWVMGSVQLSASCEVEVVILRHEFRTRRADGSKPEIMLVRRAG